MDQSTSINQIHQENQEDFEDFVQDTLDEIEYEDDMLYEKPVNNLPIKQQYKAPGPPSGIKIPDVPVNYIYKDIKEYSILGALYFILTLPMFINLTSKYVPWLIHIESGEQTISGVIARAILLVVSYYTIKNVLL